MSGTGKDFRNNMYECGSWDSLRRDKAWNYSDSDRRDHRAKTDLTG